MVKIGIILLICCGLLFIIARTQRKINKSKQKIIKEQQKSLKKQEEESYKTAVKRRMDKDLYDTKLEIKKSKLKSNAECVDKIKKSGTEYTVNGGLKKDTIGIAKVAVGAKLGNFNLAASGAEDLVKSSNKEKEKIPIEPSTLPESK